MSVVIPCYNYGHYLEGAVNERARTNLDVEVEVIVIDDASPDGSGEVAVALARTDPRIRLLRHAQNKGHIATYNEGLAMVESDYVVLLSADDLLVPGSLAAPPPLMEAHPSVGFVYGHPLEFSDEPPPPRTERSGWTDLVRPRVAGWQEPPRTQLHLLPRGGDAQRRPTGDRWLQPGAPPFG